MHQNAPNAAEPNPEPVDLDRLQLTADLLEGGHVRGARKDWQAADRENAAVIKAAIAELKALRAATTAAPKAPEPVDLKTLCHAAEAAGEGLFAAAICDAIEEIDWWRAAAAETIRAEAQPDRPPPTSLPHLRRVHEAFDRDGAGMDASVNFLGLSRVGSATDVVGAAIAEIEWWRAAGARAVQDDTVEMERGRWIVAVDDVMRTISETGCRDQTEALRAVKAVENRALAPRVNPDYERERSLAALRERQTATPKTPPDVDGFVDDPELDVGWCIECGELVKVPAGRHHCTTHPYERLYDRLEDAVDTALQRRLGRWMRSTEWDGRLDQVAALWLLSRRVQSAGDRTMLSGALGAIGTLMSRSGLKTTAWGAEEREGPGFKIPRPEGDDV